MEKKKRSPNFTSEEKENLLSIVAKFKNVIESKKTGAFYLQKKKEAWVVVAKQYNSLCTTGPRDLEMLKHFYNNIKHRARKVSASENKQRYLKELDLHSELVSRGDENIRQDKELPCETPLITTEDNSIIWDENTIEELKRQWTDEKKNIRKTGGGSYIPILTDADHQALAILDEQIRPDENPFDEAAEYFGDTIQEITMETPVQDALPVEPPIIITNQMQHKMKAKKPQECMKSAELLKRNYFKKKIELVFYQKKNEMIKYRSEKKKLENLQKKHEIEMKILKKQLEKLENQ